MNVKIVRMNSWTEQRNVEKLEERDYFDCHWGGFLSEQEWTENVRNILLLCTTDLLRVLSTPLQAQGNFTDCSVAVHQKYLIIRLKWDELHALAHCTKQYKNGKQVTGSWRTLIWLIKAINHSLSYLMFSSQCGFSPDMAISWRMLKNSYNTVFRKEKKGQGRRELSKWYHLSNQIRNTTKRCFKRRGQREEHLQRDEEATGCQYQRRRRKQRI